MVWDIFICSYAADSRWLEYCLRSIKKYAQGFRQTVVAYPDTDEDSVGNVCRKFEKVKCVPFKEWEDGHLHQNAIKTSCDLMTDADIIFHLDSDCVFTEVAHTYEYLTNGKLDLIFQPYDSLGDVPGGVPWQGITEFALGYPCPNETMRRFPLVYYRWLYSATRKRIEGIHNMPFEQYVKTAPHLGGAFHGYSEFNCLGSMALNVFPGCFHIYDVRHGLKPGHVKQFWSWSGPREEGINGPASREIPILEDITR